MPEAHLSSENGANRPQMAARALGLAGIGIGVAELAVPGRVARSLGLDDRAGLVRAFGFREIGAGIGTFTSRPAPAIWARVAGDVLDLGVLAFGLRAKGEQRRNAAIALGLVAGMTFADIMVALSLNRENEKEQPALWNEEEPRHRAGKPKSTPELETAH